MQPLRFLAAIAALVASAGAQTAIVPDMPNMWGDNPTSWPWYIGDNLSRWPSARIQCIYDSSMFTSQGINGPITITGVSWRARRRSSFNAWNGGTYNNCEIILGHAGVDQANATGNFAENYRTGVKAPASYTGPVVLQPGSLAADTVGPWFVDVTLTNAFVYDPTTGEDLIIECATDGSWTPNAGPESNDAYPIDCTRVDTFGNTVPARRIYNVADWQGATGTPLTGSCMIARLTYTSANLQASFVADKQLAGANEVVTFTDHSTTTAMGGIQSWEWDFDGDGTTDSTVQNPAVTLGAPFGLRDISLTVNDGTNPASTLTRVGHVDVGGVVADFTFMDMVAPAVINFTDASLGNPTMWSWDLDGDSVADSTMQNPQWVYPFEETTDVTLTASNAGGSDSITKTVDTRDKVCTTTQFDVWFGSGGGVAFDVDVLNPNGITVKELGVLVDTPGATIDLTIWTSSSRFLDTNAAAWTQVSTGTGVCLGGDVFSPVDVGDFCLPFGVTALMVEYTSLSNRALQLYKVGDGSSGPGSNTYYANADLTIQCGSGTNPVFSPTGRTEPRIWTGCIVYDQGTSGSLTSIGPGCPNSTTNVAQLGGQGGAVPNIGQPIPFEITSAPANQALSFVMVGFVNVGGADLVVIGMPGCRLYADPLVGLPAPTSGAGVGSAMLGIPNDPNSVGLSFFAQGFVADPGFNPFGAVLTNALNGIVGCP